VEAVYADGIDKFCVAGFETEIPHLSSLTSWQLQIPLFNRDMQM